MGWTLEYFLQVEQLFLWFVLLLTLIYFWSTSEYGFWSNLGVPHRRPIPFFGNIFRAVCNLQTIHSIQQEIYKEFKDCSLVGTYHFTSPRLMVKDPMLVEHVMVKDFTTFMDRGRGVNPNSSGLTAHLLNLDGQKWRSLRNKLTPVFTTGKMKMMMDQLEECSKRFKAHLQKEIEKGHPLEIKQQISGYTLDVIGSCAFGLEFNAIDDPNSKFRKIGEQVFGTSKAQLLKRWLQEEGSIFKKLLFKIVRQRSEAPAIEKYFVDVIKNTTKYREENRIVREDFIQLLMDIQKLDRNRGADEDEVFLDDKVMASNSFVFFLAGYETTASTLSFLLYELAVNQDVQEKLYREVTKILRKNDNQLTWDTIKQMEYLDQVKSETLRKYPPVTETRRLCLKKYKFPKSNVVLPEGTVVSIPIYSLQHDPEYYPQPEKFQPERFSEKNKNKIVKYTYLPFGDGPRICIGMRFAIMEIKMLVARLIQDFSVSLNKKTISPLQMNPESTLLSPIGGIWLDFKPRKKPNGQINN